MWSYKFVDQSNSEDRPETSLIKRVAIPAFMSNFLWRNFRWRKVLHDRGPVEKLETFLRLVRTAMKILRYEIYLIIPIWIIGLIGEEHFEFWFLSNAKVKWVLQTNVQRRKKDYDDVWVNCRSVKIVSINWRRWKHRLIVGLSTDQKQHKIVKQALELS